VAWRGGPEPGAMSCRSLLGILGVGMDCPSVDGSVSTSHERAASTGWKAAAGWAVAFPEFLGVGRPGPGYFGLFYIL
jgi:hypothetical protein